MTTSFDYDVFLSHNDADKPRVRRLAERLRNAGVKVWFDEWVIKPGDEIYPAIEQGLKQSRTLVLCVSSAALESEWVGMERSSALFRNPSNSERRFIPVLLEACKPPETLRRYQHVDLREGSGMVLENLLTSFHPPEDVRQGTPSSKSKKNNKKLPTSDALEHPEQQSVLEQTLPNTIWIRHISISPDGAWLASTSRDNKLNLWSIADGNHLETFAGQTNEVWCMTITPDSERLISGEYNHTIRVWDKKSGKLLTSWETKNHNALALAVLPDGQRVLSAGGGIDPTLKIWNIADGRHHMTLAGHTRAVTSLALTLDGTKALSGAFDNTIRYWNLKTGECLTTLRGHLGSIRSVALSPDGRFAASGSEDKSIKLWNLDEKRCVGTLEGHCSEVHSVAFNLDATLIASAGFTDGTIRLWERKSGVCLEIISLPKSHFPTVIAFIPDDNKLVAGTTKGPIHLYRLNSLRPTAATELPRRYTNAKVVLLGEGGVGKTSLAHRLVNDEYVIKDRTHGMNVWRLDLPLTPDETIEREALLWDLAGQEDYRLIHQLFLKETALALLLINPQKEDPFIECGDWLKALEGAVGEGREPLELLIPSQIDVGGLKVSDRKIEHFCKQQGFLTCLPTSAKSGENCSDAGNRGKPSALKRLIAESIPWEELPWTSTPRLLAELKNRVVAMYDQEDIRLLRFSELRQRLEQSLPHEAFNEPQVRTAVTLLSNHGLVQVFEFGDLVLLRPDLLNGYAGAVIRAARAHKNEMGCVPEAYIFNPDFDFTGVDRLAHRADEELLLRALVQTLLDHSLCIAEETPEGRHLVFPSQYRRERDISTHPEIFVSYRFTGEWQSIYTTLVVRLWYSREFDHNDLWRNAADFLTPAGHTLGLKLDKTGEGEATINLFFEAAVSDEFKVIFIEYVHRHLARYAKSVERDRRYICECGNAVTDLDAVRKRMKMKRAFITCQECDEQVPLIDFIEQHMESDPVARKVLGMEETATRELDNQALEQILTGHMMAISGEANQIYRELTQFDYGIDGEIEFKDNDGRASGSKIYVQLKSGGSYLRERKSDGREIFDVKSERHLEYWVNQPVEVWLVIRDAEETIRWMNVSRYLREREDKTSRQIIFEGEKLDAEAVWKARDPFFPPHGGAGTR